MKPISLLLAFCMLLASSPATYAAPSEDDLKKVVSLSKKAAIKYDKGEYKSALSLYRQARALWKNPKLTFAIVKCLEALKQYEEAKTFAKLGLQENPKPVMKSRLESKLTFLRRS
jgi:tetratricopeptide (TPR) repeat protein